MTDPKTNSERSTLDHALALARRGLPVFPIVENGKIPAIGGWQQRATTDEAKIRKMWTEHDPVIGATRLKPYNIGVYTGDFLVGDVDIKKGKKGQETFDELDILNGFPRTLKVKTASGGLHIYYRPEEPAASGVNNVGPGFDTRGVGGYVVGPGSVVDGNAYVIVDDAPIAKAPKWFEDHVGRPAPKTTAKQVVQLLDTPARIEQAKALLEQAHPAIEGNGGNTTTFKTAARVKDLGISELTALDLMAAVYNPRCAPPWGWEELATIVSNAYKHGKRPIGDAAPEADFVREVETSAEIPIGKPAKKPRRLSILLPNQITIIQRSHPLVKGWIDEESFIVTYGDSNVGKSFFDLALHAHIALGKPWAGRKVTQGATVYVAAEGGRSAQLRVAALKKWHKVDDMPLGLIASPVNLMDPKADVQELIDIMLEAEEVIGKIRYFTIDTLARAMAGGNENSPDDMGAFIANKDAIRAAVKAAGNTIHHKGKDSGRGMRGHSSLFAAADTVIEVERGLATAVKQRDMDTGDSVDFDLAEMELGKDEEGEPITTAVAVCGTGGASLDFGGNPARNALVVRALRDAVSANGGKPVSWETWQRMCNRYILEGLERGFEGPEIGGEWQSPGNSVNKALRTVRTRLDENGVVKKNKREQWTTV